MVTPNAHWGQSNNVRTHVFPERLNGLFIGKGHFLRALVLVYKADNYVGDMLLSQRGNSMGLERHSSPFLLKLFGKWDKWGKGSLAFCHFTALFNVLFLVLCFPACGLNCVQLCHPMDCSPRGSSAHGILQARILERVAISSSRGSSQPQDQTHISCSGRRVLYHWATWESTVFFPKSLVKGICHYTAPFIQRLGSKQPLDEFI